MHTIELTDDELRLLHAALHSYRDDFGHEEADVLRRIKDLLAKLPAEPTAGSRGGTYTRHTPERGYSTSVSGKLRRRRTARAGTGSGRSPSRRRGARPRPPLRPPAPA